MKKMNDNDLNNYLTIAKKDAIKAIKNFFANLNIDPNLFKHIYQAKILLVNEADLETYYPNYNPETNTIEYLYDDVKSTFSVINKYGINSSYIKAIYNTFVSSIIHEMLHANRALMLENGLNSKNFIHKITDDEKRKELSSFGHDIAKYEELLYETLSGSYAKDFGQYIPVKAQQKPNDQINLVAFDKVGRKYVEFKNQKFNEKFNGDIQKYFVGLSLELESIHHEITDVIYEYPSKEQKKPKQLVGTASDFYHNYNSNNINDLAIFKKLMYQDDFEEIIVETLACIIYMNRNKKYIDLNELCSRITSSESAELDLKIGAYLIKKCGMDLIDWYVLSTYQDSYTDYFEKIFEDDYLELLKNMSIVFGPNEYPYEEKIKAKRQIMNIISQNKNISNKR